VTQATATPATQATATPATQATTSPTTKPSLLLTGTPGSLPTTLPRRRGPSYADLRIADTDGWTSGLAVGLISNSPLVLGFSALPVIAGINTLGQGAVGFFVGDKLITAGAIGAGAAVAELAGGIYLLGTTRRKRPSGGLAREVWNASFDAGFGLAQGLHGLGYIAIGIPLLLMSDNHLDEFLLAVDPYRVLGVSSIVLGSALTVVGGIFAWVGFSRGPRLLRRVAVAPLIGRDLAGLSVGGAF
jgi:hypothetical protein